jgi:flagellar hook-associated protein 2
MAISSLGVGSGLDLSALVKQLVAAERQPKENRLNRREADLQARLSAFGTVKGGLSGLETVLSKLADLKESRTATSSDSSRLSVSASASAEPGRYSVEVKELARAQTLATQALDAFDQPLFTDADDPVGTGTLTLQVGDGDPVQIVIDEDNNSLRGVRDAINQADAGVQASIVNDGTGARLVLTSNTTGAANTITLTVSDDDGNDTDIQGLSRLASGNLDEVAAAKDAEVVINGLTVTSASNTLDETIEGLTLTLRGTSEEGTTITVDVARNRGAVRSAINEFITAYNAVVEQIGNLTRYDPEAQQGSLLVGDSTLRGIRSRLSQGLMANGGESGALFTNLVNLGIKSDSNGKLTLDSATLDSALDEDFEGVIALLNDVSGGLRETVRGFTETGGLLDARTDGLRTRIKDIDRQRDVLANRIEQYEARLVRQFGAMDAMVAQMQQTSQYLDQQLSALNAMLGQNRKR